MDQETKSEVLISMEPSSVRTSFLTVQNPKNAPPKDRNTPTKIATCKTKMSSNQSLTRGFSQPAYIDTIKTYIQGCTFLRRFPSPLAEFEINQVCSVEGNHLHQAVTERRNKKNLVLDKTRRLEKMGSTRRDK